MHDLAPGLLGEATLVVGDEETAARLGSGLVPVFGTPALVALMERAAVQAISVHLPPGQTSVGTGIDLRHLSATPVGLSVRARATLTQVEGRRLVFAVKAWDEVEQIAEATHERVIVDTDRFVAKAAAKASKRTA